MRKLIHEIHRRSLWQVLGIYLAGSWVALQVVEQLAEAAALPPWVRPLALVMLIIGLPVVLATAFVQQGLPGASQPDPPRPAPSGAAPSAAPTPGEVWSETTGSGPRRWFTWKNAIAGGVLAFALWGLIAAGWVLLGGVEERGDSDADLPTVASDGGATSRGYAASVAVMPFDNLGSAGEAHISDGFTEEVIAQLARISDLKVISRTSVAALAGANLTLPEIGDTLGVEHVLRGSVRRSGDQIRVTVELMEAATDAIVWVETYTRLLENIFDLQDEIAGRVSSALIENVAQLQRPSGAARAVKSEAYEAFLRGRSAIHARTAAAFAGAIAAFREAIAADPTFAPAYAGLSSALGLSITYGHDMELGPYDRFREALAFANRALELDPELAEAYGARSYVSTKARSPVGPAMADVERAVALRPNSADMRGWYAHSLARAERHEEAMRQAQMAIELDPIAPGRRTGLALDAFAAREYQVALDEARSALALQPGLGPPKAVAAYALLLLRRPAECLRLEFPDLDLARAACLLAAGREAEATELAERGAAVARGTADGTTRRSDIARSQVAEGLAIYYALAGDSEASLGWHELAFALSPDGVDFRMYAGGLFDRVRAVPGHEERVAEIWQAAWESVRGEG